MCHMFFKLKLFFGNLEVLGTSLETSLPSGDHFCPQLFEFYSSILLKFLGNNLY